MTSHSTTLRPVLYSLLVAAASLALSACGVSSSTLDAQAPSPPMKTDTAPNPDPRLSLKAGWLDAGEALWNMRWSRQPALGSLLQCVRRDGATSGTRTWRSRGHYVVQGNFSGFQIWDVANAERAARRDAVRLCWRQGDVSVYKNLVFVSVEAGNGRVDCGLQGVKDSVSTERFRGIRIFDISDIAHPKQVAAVQTCRGSHTNTVVTDPRDPVQHLHLRSAMQPAPVRRPSWPAAPMSAPEDEPNYPAIPDRCHPGAAGAS